MPRRPSISTLFPYTTLFRSVLSARRSTVQECFRLTKSCRGPPIDRNTASEIIPADRQSTRRLWRSEEHTSELQSHHDLVCRLLLEKKNKLSTFVSLLLYFID